MKYVILFIFSFSFSFSDYYIPKNSSEIKILEKVRSKEIVLGIVDSEFYSKEFGNEKVSMNDIVIELLVDYLKLNISLKKESLEKLTEDLVNSSIDGVSFINRNEKQSKLIYYTEAIYNKKLYVVSTDKKIHKLDDLNNENIYTHSNFIYRELIEAILYNNDLNVKIIEVEDLNLYKDEFIITDLPANFDAKYGVKISNSPGISIGLNNSLKDLIPILNNAINEKYEEVFTKKIRKINNEISKKNLVLSLNKEEKEYLKTLKEINIIYDEENRSILSYYSSIDESYRGFVPKLLEIIGKQLDIKINDLTATYPHDLSSLNNENVDTLTISKTKKRNENFIFSNKIDSVNTYLINIKRTHRNNGSMGIISNSVEKEISHKYDISRNIKSYENFYYLIEALNDGKVHNVLTNNITNLDTQKYNIVFFEEIPVNLAFKKEDYLLRDIINKAILKLVDKNEVIEDEVFKKDNEDIYLKKRQDDKNKLFMFSLATLIILALLFFVRLISEIRHKKDLLKDPLSLMPNRIVFNNFTKTKGDNLNGYVFIIDLDDFKNINDTYGHEIGDLVISEFSRYLREQINSENIFRISGDEFYGMFDNDLDGILELLKVYDNSYSTLKNYNISYSMGIYKKTKDISIKLAFKYADLAMFEAKKKKGNSFKIADEFFINKKYREEKIMKLLEGDLDEIYPVFQSKMNLSTNLIIGVESLARCNSKALGMIYPTEFIPLAENYNFIHKIDYKIAEESIKLLKTLIESQQIDEDFRLSFNVSVKTFMRRDLVKTIYGLLKKYDVSGNYIEIEITESLLINNMSDILNKLNLLIKLGIQISLDDFTAGHSTAGVLPILPISIIKFDKALLDSFDKNEKKAEIVYKSLISLVKKLELKIVAEGIENISQLNFLKNEGVDYGQGYLIEKPKSYEGNNLKGKIKF